jgi:hypothetical protein
MGIRKEGKEAKGGKGKNESVGLDLKRKTGSSTTTTSIC